MALLPEVLAAGPVELHRWRTDIVDELMAAIALSHAELREWLPWADPLPSRDAELEVLSRGEASFDADDDYGYWMREVASGELVGTCGLHRRTELGGIEIGYWVRSDRTGRGYATAAAKTLTDAAFEHLGVRWVEIHMDAANKASAAVPPKLGYELDHHEQRELLAPGHTGHGLVWIMRRDGGAG